jgi:sterol desaturase/sphingolipid hydroxylase (fatty acid hydroxylase superfamily)
MGAHWLSFKWQLATIPLMLVYENIFEWATHKYVLHGLGKNRKSFWSFHWIDHHSTVRKNGFIDRDYLSSYSKWNAQTKEILALLGGAVLHGPLLFVAPLAYATLVYSGARYYYVHRKAHLNPQWAKDKLPWHYDHHMAPNQNANWCVTRPWADWIFGTREIFLNRESSVKQRPLLD